MKKALEWAVPFERVKSPTKQSWRRRRRVVSPPRTPSSPRPPHHQIKSFRAGAKIQSCLTIPSISSKVRDHGSLPHPPFPLSCLGFCCSGNKILLSSFSCPPFFRCVFP